MILMMSIKCKYICICKSADLKQENFFLQTGYHFVLSQVFKYYLLPYLRVLLTSSLITWEEIIHQNCPPGPVQAESDEVDTLLTVRLGHHHLL